MPPDTTPADPDGLLQLRDGIYAADLVVAAVAWFDFFTWLEANPSDIEGVCEGLSIANRPADVLCTLLAEPTGRRRSRISSSQRASPRRWTPAAPCSRRSLRGAST